MKKLSLVFVFIVFVGLLLSCEQKKVLHVYNWSYYTPDSILRKFEKEFDCVVKLDEYASNEEMFAKLKAGGMHGYDIAFPSDDYVSILIKEHMLVKLDHSMLPNLYCIDPMVSSKRRYDSAMNYSVPYYLGAAGIFINISKVTEHERSWNIFSREDLRGKMTMLDDMREVLGAGGKFLGYSANSRKECELSEITDLIVTRWKPNLVKFDSDTYNKGYVNGDFWVVHCYPETIVEECLDNPELMANSRFFFPDEGTTGYIDAMVILRGSKQIDLAHEFINFIHRPEIYAEFCDAFKFPSTVNIPAREFVVGPSIYEVEDVVYTEIKYDLGNSYSLYSTAWFDLIRSGQ